MRHRKHSPKAHDPAKAPFAVQLAKYVASPEGARAAAFVKICNDVVSKADPEAAQRAIAAFIKYDPNLAPLLALAVAATAPPKVAEPQPKPIEAEIESDAMALAEFRVMAMALPSAKQAQAD